MQNRLKKLTGAFLITAVVLAIALPQILHRFGLHPAYKGEYFVISPGKKALIIGTNHGILSQVEDVSGDPTGLASSELTHPYYTFLDAGLRVDLASILGGRIPVDPKTLSRMIITPDDKRALNDPMLQAKLTHSIPIDDVDFTSYDIIFLAGGWGAAYDFGYSALLARKISDAYAAPNTIIGAVCHGVLGLINARDPQGDRLIKDRRMTGVTNKQIKELRISVTPQHPETELKAAGALFEANTALLDIFATHVVVDDGERFVTGQNQNSALEAAHTILGLVAAQSAGASTSN